MADNSSSKPKRRFKNPETFRERVVNSGDDKSTSSDDASQAKSRIKKGAAKALNPASKSYKKVRSVKQLNIVFKVFSIIGKVVFPKYLRTSFQELKKVTWPSFKQSRKLTYAVLIFAIVFGASVAIVDYGLGKVFKHLLLK